MIWPFTELSTLRAQTLDYNRQIAHLSARCELLSQQVAQLTTQQSQYIDDLRTISKLNAPPDNSPPANSDDDVTSTPLPRTKVLEALEEFRNRAGEMDMLSLNKGWYERAGELDNSNPYRSDATHSNGSEAAADESSNTQ